MAAVVGDDSATLLKDVHNGGGGDMEDSRGWNRALRLASHGAKNTCMGRMRLCDYAACLCVVVIVYAPLSGLDWPRRSIHPAKWCKQWNPALPSSYMSKLLALPVSAHALCISACSSHLLPRLFSGTVSPPFLRIGYLRSAVQSVTPLPLSLCLRHHRCPTAGSPRLLLRGRMAP